MLYIYIYIYYIYIYIIYIYISLAYQIVHSTNKRKSNKGKLNSIMLN